MLIPFWYEYRSTLVEANEDIYRIQDKKSFDSSRLNGNHSLNSMDSYLESGGQTVVAKNGPMAQPAKAQSLLAYPRPIVFGRPNIAANNIRLVQSISYELTCNRR